MPTSALPPVIDPVTIDGYTQPGSSMNSALEGNNAVLMIELSGSGAGAADGLSIVAGNSIVQGLVVNNWQLNGIRLATNGNNGVIGNFIGTDPTGTEARGNQFSGVTVVFATSTNNGISQNVISGNGTGISTAGPGNQATQILRNMIGTNAAGTASIPNFNGIVVSAGNNMIGSTGPFNGNVISGNSNCGIVIDSVNAVGCKIFNNRIGTDASGAFGVPNGHTGISISNTSDILVGGSFVGNRNLISGNADLGIAITTSSNVTLEGNWIGTDITGAAPLGNGVTGAPFGGVYLSDSSNCHIGGGLLPNVIAFNEGNGVTVFSFGATAGNTVTHNAIYSNSPRAPSAGLGIDIGDDGPTANDPQDADVGVNGLQNFPVVTAVTISPTDVRIVGHLQSTPSTEFSLEFSASPDCSPRPQSFLQAAGVIGGANVTTDGNGDVAFDVTLPVVVDPSMVVTATATDPNGNTSEISRRMAYRVTPRSGPSEGGTGIVVSGFEFQAGATVTIGATSAAGVNVDSAIEISATTPALAPGTLNDVTVTNPDATSGTIPGGWVSDFLDVPQAHIFYAYVTKLVANGITVGCGGGNYCPSNSITRAQMAVFLLKGRLGVCYAPPAETGTVFGDVPAGSFGAPWIEDLAARGITGGCGGGNYCPTLPVTRAQMAVFLLKTAFGTGYAPPPESGTVFEDVPAGSFAADWIEDLAARGITAGCNASPSLYCPTSPNTRGQMSVFIVKTFQLP